MAIMLSSKCVLRANVTWVLWTKFATRRTERVCAKPTLPASGAMSVRPDSTTSQTAYRAIAIPTVPWTPRALSMAINHNANAKWDAVDHDATNVHQATSNFRIVSSVSATQPAQSVDHVTPTLANAIAKQTSKA
jgi:hypothetical protein